MRTRCNRRGFIRQAAGATALATGLPCLTKAAAPAKELPVPPEHTLTVISGKPRERGKQYGQKFKDGIASFLDKEIYRPCAKFASREELLRYAGACAKQIKEYSPTITDELEGMAEGSGLKLEELVLITAHEETAGHKDGKLPPLKHCTALAAAPPDTRDGCSYVGQNWDWMESVYGLSSMLLWKRPEGPSVLAYAYPGLWTGAGLNSAGIALCWTWGNTNGIKGPRVGIPSYVLIAQMLYQDTLKDALEEVKRARHAGWFCFVLADGKGQIAGVDGTPEKLAIEKPRGHTARASFVCREILEADPEKPVKVLPQCQRMFDLLVDSKGKLDRPTLQTTFGDHKSTICNHPGKGFMTVDSMLFNCTTKEVHIQRGPGCAKRWKTFRFE
jgi:isopenicillin-N N-acyltransferase-like protein